MSQGSSPVHSTVRNHIPSCTEVLKISKRARVESKISRSYHPERRNWLYRITAAARGAPRHDQRRAVCGVYDESSSKYVNTYPACVRIHALPVYYCTKKSLPVRPRGLCSRRLDGTLSVSNLIQSPLGGAQKKITSTVKKEKKKNTELSNSERKMCCYCTANSSIQAG